MKISPVASGFIALVYFESSYFLLCGCLVPHLLSR